MRNALIAALCLLGIAIILISVYLTPDDLKACGGPSSNSGCQPADAIVAVSGGNTDIRTSEAIALYKAGWSDTLIFSGAAADMSGPSNAEVMRDQAIRAGVPESDIRVDPFARTTKENAEEVKNLLVEAGSGGVRRVILVTSPYHQRRASLEFKELAGEAITIVNHPTPNDPDWTPLWWLTPRGWWLASGELIKIAAFYAGESQ